MKDIVAPRDRMFFLLGRGRSGTTLLKSLLDAHPSISVAPEALFVMNLYHHYGRAEWTDERIEGFSRHVFLERRLRRWSVERDQLVARWRAMKDCARFADLVSEAYELHADATGKNEGRFLGDKNPRYSLCAAELRAIFPRAKFVHMVRDYRDNVLSFLHVPFDLKSPVALAHRWVRYNAAILGAARLAPDAFHLLRFEDLLSAPVPTLTALCRFLGVEMDPRMLDARDPESGYGVAWHRHVSSSIDPALAGQWRRNLDTRQVEEIDRICQPFAAQFGYEPARPTRRRSFGISSGAAIGWGLTTLERHAFRLPVGVQTLINNAYRRFTGNLIR